MRNMELVKILEDNLHLDERMRAGEFWYNQEDSVFDWCFW